MTETKKKLELFFDQDKKYLEFLNGIMINAIVIKCSISVLYGITISYSISVLSGWVFFQANEDELKDSVILVFANKQDLPNALSVSEMTEKLNLHNLKGRKVFIDLILRDFNIFYIDRDIKVF